jgi:hypothetical protein
MKRFSTPVPILILVLSAVLIVTANRSLNARETKVSIDSNVIFAATAGDGGLLVIRRSPVLGSNVTVTVTIDGKPVGIVRRGQIYERFLTTGRHVLLVSPNALGDPWRATLDVRAGETYSYTVSYRNDGLMLTPAASSR